MSTWQPTAEDLATIVTEQNPWRSGGTVPALLAPPSERPLATHLWSRLIADEPRRFQVLLGPRRVGKTTVMYHTARHLLDEGVPAPRVVYLSVDHPLLLDLPLGMLVRTVTGVTKATASEPVYLLLDEVVYADDWDRWLKTMYDERWPVRVVATSSATAALDDRRSESGVGRWEVQYLLPYSLPEVAELLEVPFNVTASENLGTTIRTAIDSGVDASALSPLREILLLTGGFPELLTDPSLRAEGNDPATQLLRSQRVLRADAVERAVYKDIPQSFGVESPLALERVLYLLAAQIGGLISPTKLCREAGLSQPTFDRYLLHLERAFLVFTLPNYSGVESKVQRRGRKLYFVDVAVRNAALQRGAGPLSSAAEMGLLTENLCASHLHRLATHAGVRLFHWRDGDREVDLVYDDPNDPLAFEIASSVRHSKRGIATFVDRHPRFTNRCYLVAPDAPPLTPESTSRGIGTIPLELFLGLVGLQAERALAAQLGVNN